MQAGSCECSRRLDGPADELPGVNVSGYLRTESGVGSVIRGYLRALRSLNVPTALRDLSALNVNRAEDRTLTRFDDDHPYEVNLVCADVDLHYAVLSHLGEEFFDDHYNVALWAWELPDFPRRWYDRFAYYDEVWVATSFVAKALAPIAPIPVVEIPPVLSAATPGSRAAGRRRLGVSVHEFVFLFVFDFHSHFARKNPLAIIDAFRSAFKPADPVRLVLKCVNGNSNAGGLEALRTRAQGYPIFVYDGYWPAEEVRDLTAACDAYVSLHRSEGVGLTISDAMALGEPVLATGWSGNMDFMNVNNSFPVRYQMVALEENVGPYPAGAIWAEPCIDHAAELMRHVFDNPEDGFRRGQAAGQDIETNYGEAPVANLIRQRLQAIAVRRRWPSFRQEVKAAYGRYQQLPERIREVVRSALPADATVLVVSKGDNALLHLDGRTAWHFPQTENGAYAGYYPATSAAAIAHLEALRKKGAEFLLLPPTAFWWLEHYQEFRQHLEDRYRALLPSSCETCKIFALAGSNAERVAI